MSGVLIEEDFVYKNRLGEFIGPLTRDDQTNPLYPWRFREETYTNLGRHKGIHEESPLDLIDVVGSVSKSVGVGVRSEAGFAKLSASNLISASSSAVGVSANDDAASDVEKAASDDSESDRDAQYVIARETLPSMSLETARNIVMQEKLVGARICRVVEVAQQTISLKKL